MVMVVPVSGDMVSDAPSPGRRRFAGKPDFVQAVDSFAKQARLPIDAS
jgi:hypothetical protein